MNYQNQIKEALLGSNIVEAAKQELCLLAEDFRGVQEAYRSALQSLCGETDAHARHLSDAIDQQCASLFFFAGVQGLRMNLTHFLCPMSPNCTWPQVDDENFLRLGLAEGMPGYTAAELEISDLTAMLEKKDTMDAVTEYRATLETGGMRLAHYWGYLLGNDLLPHCIPGYRPDSTLDLRYRNMLEAHFRRAS